MMMFCVSRLSPVKLQRVGLCWLAGVVVEPGGSVSSTYTKHL